MGKTYPDKIRKGLALTMLFVLCAALLVGCSRGGKGAMSSLSGTGTSVTESFSVSQQSSLPVSSSVGIAVSKTASSKESGTSSAVSKKPSAISSPHLSGVAASKSKVSQVGFGFYGVQPDGNITPEFYSFVQSDYVNTFIIDGLSDTIQEAHQYTKSNSSRFWVGVSGLTGIAGLASNWQQKIDATVQYLNNAGAGTDWLGFYLDEPELWHITNAQLREITKYMRDKTGKRVFVCFSMAGIYPEKWHPDYTYESVTPSGSQYITDAAYDVYEAFNKANFQLYTQKLKACFGRTDMKIWYIPCVMSYQGTTNEAYAMAHLQGCYDLLRTEQNPGGLMCYTYRSLSSGDDASLGNTGLSSHPDWTKLMSLVQTIGKNICSGKAFGR